MGSAGGDIHWLDYSLRLISQDNLLKLFRLDPTKVAVSLTILLSFCLYQILFSTTWLTGCVNRCDVGKQIGCSRRPSAFRSLNSGRERTPNNVNKDRSRFLLDLAAEGGEAE